MIKIESKNGEINFIAEGNEKCVFADTIVVFKILDDYVRELFANDECSLKVWETTIRHFLENKGTNYESLFKKLEELEEEFDRNKNS